jgi:hypothetical protein
VAEALLEEPGSRGTVLAASAVRECREETGLEI